MQIGVHAVPAFSKQPTGVEYYAREIITRMIAAADERARFTLYTDREPEDAISGAQSKVLKSPAFWTQVRLSLEMVLRPPDTLFVPANALPRDLPKRTVLTVHGAEFMQAPEHYSFRSRYYLNLLTRDGLKRADAVIVPSYATASALAEYFGADEEKIHVIHHGAPRRPAGVTPKASPGSRPYFLFIGRLETHKNVHGLIAAFSKLRREHAELQHELVLAGKPGFGYEQIKRSIQESGYRAEIREVGYVSEKEKWALLSGADAFCFPSFAEGFGIPVLEAQAAGCPVMTSATTALPEVAGASSAILVDPHQVSHMTDALFRLASNADLRRTLIGHGRKNLARFSWEKAAGATLRVLLG